MFTKVKFHIEERTTWNLISGSFTKLEPHSRYDIILEITRFFFFKQRVRFKNSFYYHHELPPYFATEEAARQFVEELLLKGKQPGMVTTRIVPPSYTFKNIQT